MRKVKVSSSKVKLKVKVKSEGRFTLSFTFVRKLNHANNRKCPPCEKQAQTENAQLGQGGTVGSLFVSRMNDLGEIQEISPP